MKIKISWKTDNNTTQTLESEVEPIESDVWKLIGEQLLNIPIPNKILVKTEQGDVTLVVSKRGTYKKDGVTYPSMFVREESNTLHGLQPSVYPETYLTCIHPESNNYKYYWMKPKADGIWVTYGRIGSERGEMFGTRDVATPYPSYLFWIRYYEKLSKGYIDASDVYLITPVKKQDTNSSKKQTANNSPSYQLYEMLRRFAHQVVEANLTSTNITEGQIKASRKYLKAMGERKTVKGFNTQLLKLLTVSPRKVRYIDELLASSTDDFADIIEREENLVTAMEALVKPDSNSNQDKEGFDKYGIEVYLATDKQKEQVLSRLSDSLKPKVKSVYRVINPSHKKNFNEYIEKYNIKKVKQLWHGSRNENWLSIALNGLKLNPNAVITGKMFGQGIYFAPSSMKSWNYTSFRGTSWAQGTSSKGFMGLYATAYGHPNDVYTANDYTQAQLLDNGYNCVHAHAGPSLRNDEIIYYSENAMLLQYIVEFSD